MSAEGLEFNERMQTDDLLRRRRALALPTDVIEEAGHLRLALRRLASLEAFTAPLDLTAPVEALNRRGDHRAPGAHALRRRGRG